MSARDILIRPVDIPVAVGRRIPRYMIVVCEVLRDVQNRTARIAASIEHAAMLVGPEWLVIPTCATHVQVCLLEVLRTMRVERIAFVRHLAAAIHAVMPMTRPVRLANTTEVYAFGISMFTGIMKLTEAKKTNPEGLVLNYLGV